MIVIWLILSLVTGALAARKGYSFILWALAAGAIGLVALSFQPFANNPQLSEEEKARLKKQGNTVGGVLAVIGWAAMAIRFSEMIS